MTNRLSMGVLFASLIVLMTSMSAFAERPGGKEWTGSGEIQNPLINGNLPLIFRTSAGTTWVDVGQNCDPADTANSPDGQTPDKVWCFEGADGDSTWPSGPGGTGKHETFDHWSLFNPPNNLGSKWHVSQRFFGSGPPAVANVSQGEGVLNRGANNYNAWCGCDSIGTNADCDDVAFWIFKEGYGDSWNYALTFDMTTHGHDPSGGGTIQFDVRYDVECNYDYMYLEYLNNAATPEWVAVVDTSGTPAVFNAISGNEDVTTGNGDGRECGEDIYSHSDQSGGSIVHGNSEWLEDVTFPIPGDLEAAGLKLRWRGFSDGAWSDADGRGDTDGVGAIDNVLVTFTTGGTTASDDFEMGDFDNATNGTWTAGGLTGNTYDGWHLTFDPMYKNKGNTCTFSDDWMWASKPDTGAIPENGFSFYLVTPVINSVGWTGGVIEYAQYLCMESAREDYINTHVRVFDNTIGGGSWSLWNDFDGFITFAGCEFWNMNGTEDLTPFITSTVDSLQVAWETLDISQDGEFSWGKHGGVNHLVDNVSVGSFNGEATVFTARVIDIYADTFSRSDPAHTPFLQNAEQGLWEGTHGDGQGGRAFANSDSLSVSIADFNGITAANVVLHWRQDDGGTLDISAIGAGPAWLTIAMDLALPDPLSTTDEGTYRAIIGDDLGGNQDMTAAADNEIWDAGTTVQYYVKVRDNDGADATFPGSLDTAAPFEFSILPLGNTLADGVSRILLVDDYTRNITDFENSTGFSPTGGAGFGAFAAPVFAQPEVMVSDALDLLFPTTGGGNTVGVNNLHYPHHFDKYDVQGGGSSVQCEPRGLSEDANDVGGFMNDFGVPRYEALIWLQGTFDEYSYADTTRIDLATYLDNGGNILSSGDQVAFHLGSGGNDADSTLNFLGTYFGISFPTNADEATTNRVLNTQGTGVAQGVFPASGVSAANPDGLAFETGLYGECPIRRTFDRLTELDPEPGGSVNWTEMTYQNGGAGDDNRASVIGAKRTAVAVNKGIAIHSGWGLSALLSRNNIACYMDPILTGHFALTTPGAVSCIDNGVGAPNVSSSFGFGLRQASPNPFVSSTSIAFSVANRSHVSIEVYNILGQKVRTLVDENMDANSYVRDWDGRSDSGAEVSSGIYFYKMVAGEFSDTKKTVLLR